MKTLNEAIQAHGKLTAPALIKYLNECQMNDWADLTKSNLNDFKDLVLERVAQSTARTYFAVFKAILARYEDDAEFCKDYKNILKAKNEKPLKTYLTMKDLEKLEKVPCKSKVEQYVMDEFLIGAYTGMRISDAREVSQENMMNGYLSYVSIKTGVQAVVPLKPGVAERILRVQEYEGEVTMMGYNKAIRRLCKKAGLTESVKVFKGGEHIKGEKWKYVSSHTARISFCTNLSNLGVPLMEIAKMAGHTSTAMTERYIVKTDINLSERAMKFFK